MKAPFIVAVDFDQTLFETNWPHIGAPNRCLIAQLKAMRNSGDKLILWTCRAGKELEDAIEACRRENLYFDAVNENLPEIAEAFGGDCRKIFANVYLDDLSIGFKNWTEGSEALNHARSAHYSKEDTHGTH